MSSLQTPACIPYSDVVAACGSRSVTPRFAHVWCAGSLSALMMPCIAIVGTRAASAYGKAVARDFASRLSAAGCCIISGLALGIDAAAHAGTLDANGATIGVLGSGHAAFFPRRNVPLAQRIIASGGAVLSPYPPQHKAFPSNFLERNGIVAALSDAVVVIEAPLGSGALNTAGWAAGQIPVFVVPADVDRPSFAGSHGLIRDGATLVRTADDVLDDLRLKPAPRNAQRDVHADPLQKTILQMLAQGETSLEQIVADAGEAPPKVLAALSLLELAGAIEARPGGRYGIKR